MHYKGSRLLISLLLISPSSFAVEQESYNEWLLLCKESLVPESQECMIMTESENNRNLSIKKDEDHNFIVVISQSSDGAENMSDEAKNFMSMISTKLTLKPNKGIFYTANTKPKIYDDGLIDFIAGHGSFKIENLIEEMKKSKSIKVNISTAITKDNDVFSLSGFTKAYDTMSEKDTRKAIQKESLIKSNKYGNQVGIGASKVDWEKRHIANDDGGLYDKKYLVTFDNEIVQSIYFGSELPSNLDDAISYAESHSPSDSKFIKEYNLGADNRKVRVYNSKTLKNSLPSNMFTNGNKGDFIMIYEPKENSAKDITISLGNHP